LDTSFLTSLPEEATVDLAPGFSFKPTIEATPATPPAPSAPSSGPLPPIPQAPPPTLGPLAGLAGSWSGKGFNTIWQPRQQAIVGSDRFLELNSTIETLEFEAIPGKIPNRGLLQGDLFMAGIRYLQQISDANVKDPDTNQDAGLHIEPGLWLSVPATTNPLLPNTVARLASIPHGTTIVAQGFMETTPGPVTVGAATITPFAIGNPTQTVAFPEQTLTDATTFRTSGVGLAGITQPMLDNPNSVLVAARENLTVVSTTTLTVSTDDATPVLGGGTANTAFLQGGTSGPNADAARVTATFWLQTTQGSAEPDLLQYSQTVLLNFNGLSWPHVTVATLHKQ
jgi:hypothetical protein